MIRSFLGKVKRKARSLLSGFTRSIVEKLSWISPTCQFFFYRRKKSERRLLVIHDLRVTPLTNGEMLCLQEMSLIKRLEAGVDKIDMAWVYDGQNPGRSDEGFTLENYHYYLSKLLPMAHVNPHLGSFFLFDSFEKLESHVNAELDRIVVYPPLKNIAGLQHSYWNYFNTVQAFYFKNGFIPKLSCQPAMVSWATRFIEREVWPAIPIVVFLRNRVECEYKNADFDSWASFFQHSQTRFNVKFIVIGTREEMDPRCRGLENVIFSKDYATTVEQDCALIQTSLAYLANTSSGMGMMAIFSDLPYIVFNFFTGGSEDIPVGSQISFAGPLQKIFWGSRENSEQLIEQFTDLYEHIDVNTWTKNFEERSRSNLSKIQRWSKYGLLAAKGL